MYRKKKEGNQVDKIDIKKLMKEEHVYPDPDDDNFQSKIYAKREFYINKMPGRGDLDKYEKIKKYRAEICAPSKFTLQPYQSFLSNFINPDTPYKGILIFHGTGTGKCVADALFYINGNVIKTENIWKKYNSGIFKKDLDGGEWSIPNKELIINSYNEKTGKIIKREVKYLYREKVDTILKKITLNNGHKITITQPHKLLTNNGWSNKLKVGDYVCVPKVVYNCPEKNKLKVTEDLAYLLSWQISEGHERNNQKCLLITNKNVNVLNKLNKWMYRY